MNPRAEDQVESDDEPLMDPPETPAEVNRDFARANRKLLILVVAVVVAIVVTRLTPLADLFGEPARLRQIIGAWGAWAPLIFVIAAAALMPLGAPRLLFCVLAGMLFGWGEGLIYALGGTLLGAYGTFLVARWGGREWVEHRLPEAGRLRKLLHEPTILKVAILRQLPIWGMLTNMLLGVSRVRHRDFLIGSLLGFLPQAAVAVLAGSGLTSDSLLLVGQLLVAAAVVLVLGWGAWRLLRGTKAAREARRLRREVGDTHPDDT